MLVRIQKRFALSPRRFPKATETISRILKSVSPVTVRILSLEMQTTTFKLALQLEPLERNEGKRRIYALECSPQLEQRNTTNLRQAPSTYEGSVLICLSSVSPTTATTTITATATTPPNAPNARSSPTHRNFKVSTFIALLVVS
ncbi:hypothetical protein E2C01_069359 [Portunus trituberculatus]|uniref:Uncharacterized protein n=1 Tax=Portunus trituberculatus TaxID=210409 RepID=A0A5B7HYP3_PORTR|nr:hypothetical protein [Portunus trituberculatus]